MYAMFMFDIDAKRNVCMLCQSNVRVINGTRKLYKKDAVDI